MLVDIERCCDTINNTQTKVKEIVSQLWQADCYDREELREEIIDQTKWMSNNVEFITSFVKMHRLKYYEINNNEEEYNNNDNMELDLNNPY